MAIIQFHAITNVRILARAWAAIASRDHRNLEIDVPFMTKDVRQRAPQLLHCAAIEAGPRPKPLPGTVIPGCHLSVIGWGPCPANFPGGASFGNVGSIGNTPRM